MYSPIKRHLVHIYFLAITNNAAINIHVQIYHVDIQFHFSLVNIYDWNA